MAITLASDVFSDAEITDGIGLGDLSSATRLWVRHWQGALAAAQQFVEPAEVPGLAAEALIGTIAAIAIGRGPREDVAGFVSAAVRELGEDDVPAVLGDPVPVLFVSPGMTSAFAELDADLQRDLRDSIRHRRTDDRTVSALTVLQHYYLAEHTDRAPTQACRRTHISLMSAADGSARDSLTGATWLHLSTCAWCTEAFHEVAFSNVALGSLIDSVAIDRVPAAPVVQIDPPVDPFTNPLTDPLEDTAPWLPAFESEPELEPVAFAPSAIAPAVQEPDVIDPLQQVPEELIPDERSTDEVGVRRRGALALIGGSRGRLVAATIATAAAVAVLVVVIGGSGSGDNVNPAAALTDPTENSALDSPTTDPSFGAPDTPSSSPTTSTTVSGPLTAAVTATTAATSGATTTPKPTKKPTKKPQAPQPTKSSAPEPTAQPTTEEPSPAPTATPTKRCNGLQHLLGLC